MKRQIETVTLSHFDDTQFHSGNHWLTLEKRIPKFSYKVSKNTYINITVLLGYTPDIPLLTPYIQYVKEEAPILYQCSFWCLQTFLQKIFQLIQSFYKCLSNCGHRLIRSQVVQWVTYSISSVLFLFSTHHF